MPGESLSGWKSRAAGVPGGLTTFIAETGVHLGDISIKDRGPEEKLLPEKEGFVGALRQGLLSGLLVTGDVVELGRGSTESQMVGLGQSPLGCQRKARGWNPETLSACGR